MPRPRPRRQSGSSDWTPPPRVTWTQGTMVSVLVHVHCQVRMQPASASAPPCPHPDPTTNSTPLYPLSVCFCYLHVRLFINFPLWVQKSKWGCYGLDRKWFPWNGLGIPGCLPFAARRLCLSLDCFFKFFIKKTWLKLPRAGPKEDKYIWLESKISS